MTSATAYANANIALIKYWGKLESEYNLPATGSLSLTLDCLGTKTSVELNDESQDFFSLNNVVLGDDSFRRVSTFLDTLRKLADSRRFANVLSHNYVQTASGLASSSSGFAALTLAASKAYGLDLSLAKLSALARTGSGSAARSIFGGFAYMKKGIADKPDECFACAATTHQSLNLCMIVLQCSDKKKAISSREGMLHTAKTSPLYQPFVDTHESDLERSLKALEDNDLKILGETMEQSTWKMHMSMLAAQPSIRYFNEISLRAITRVTDLRQSGFECYFTMDAGPHVKVLCPSEQSTELIKQLSSIPDVISVQLAKPGLGARLIES